MGSNLPEPNVYHIFFKNVGGVAATLHQGEDALLYRASVDVPTKWTLTYVDREMGICTISDTKSGRFLGIKKDSVDVDRSIYLSEDQQTWIIKKVDDGVSFIVGRTMADGRFGGWTLPRAGAPVTIGIFGSIGDWMDGVVKDAVDGLKEAGQKVKDGLEEVGKTAELVFEKIGEAAVRNAELDVPQVPMGC